MPRPITLTAVECPQHLIKVLWCECYDRFGCRFDRLDHTHLPDKVVRFVALRIVLGVLEVEERGALDAVFHGSRLTCS